MDSFTCGLCKTTFHKLEEFTEHKQSHTCHQEKETVLETEASCCEIRLPLFCPSLSQLGTTSSSPLTSTARLPSVSTAPIICSTSSASLCAPPISSAANPRNGQTSAINSTKLIQSASRLKESSKLVPVTGTFDSSYSPPNTSRSVISTTSSKAISKMCFQTCTSDTSSITSVESGCMGKMPIPVSLSMQSSSSHMPIACSLPACSEGQISDSNAGNQDHVKLIHNSDILQQNMSKNEVKDIILIEISAATEKNSDLITKINVLHPELIEGTFGKVATGANDLTDYQSEIKEQMQRTESKEEVTCLISELNGQGHTTTHECPSDHSKDSFISTDTASNNSVIMNNVQEKSVKTDIPTHSVIGKSYKCSTSEKKEGNFRHDGNSGPFYVTEGLFPYKQTTPNKLVCKDDSHMSLMKDGNIVNTSVHISSEFSAEKLNFNQGNDVLSTISLNNDQPRFEDQATCFYAQNYQAKVISNKCRTVSVTERNDAMVKDKIFSGSCDKTTEDSNGWSGRRATSSTIETISRTNDNASGIVDGTYSEVTAETVAGYRSFASGNIRTASVVNDKSDAEFSNGTAMGLVSHIDVQTKYETEVVVTKGTTSSADNFHAESGDETSSQIINGVILAANNRRNDESTISTGSLDHNGSAIRDNSEGCTEHNDGPTSDASIRIVAQTGCETPPLNEDGIDLVNSSGLISGTSDMSDLPCASAPGIYTLLLNADNTFTLVAGGYQGSSAVHSGQVFVCRHCKKFALSQIEVLNHVSTCHPEDLDNINQCILEFNALPPSCSETSDILNDTDQIFHNGITLNMETASQGSSNCLVVEGCGNYQTIQDGGCEKLSMHRRTTRRKLGRPSKEDMVKAEDQSREPKQVKRFKMEGNSIVCLDCKKVFVKQRQFDKHRCHMWQLNLEQLSCAHVNSLAFPQMLDEKMPECFSVKEDNRDMNFELHQENLFEKEIEEEWKGSRIYRTKVKAKPSTRERRKRGRPPKIDTLVNGVGSHEGLSEPQQNEDQAVDEREKSSSNAEVNSLQEHKSLQMKDMTPSISDVVVDPIGLPRESARQPLLQSIPTLPLFSNSRQQERLHKWIAQTDLSFVDNIIDKIYPDGVVKEKNGIPMYVCQECKVLFRTLLSCRRHCAKHMSRKAFTCPDCDFATTNVGALYSHYRNHTQNLYACNKCDFKARIKAHYRDHLETHNPSRHICQLCQRPYSTSNSLRSHIYLNHRNEEGMNYLWSLRRKNLEQNKQNRVFQCPICNRIFSERLLANKHLASHGVSIPKAVVKCEVCHLEPLQHGMLKRHFQKHKVIYICCVCSEPQANVSIFRNHIKDGSCNSSQGDIFNLSLMCSYTAPETFPSLFSNKKLGLGPSLRELVKHQGDCKLPVTKVPTNLLTQIQDTGYRQIYELLQEQFKASNRNGTSETCDKVMKIVVDTRCTAENEQQILPWEQHQTSLQYHEHELNYHQPHVREPEQCEGSQNASDHCLDPLFLMNQYQQELTEETDQKVVVISNVGEEQTVVVEEGQMTLMDEERFVIIHEESEEKQPTKVDRFLAHVS